MKISEKRLMETVNYYVENGVLLKVRDLRKSVLDHDLLDRKRLEKTQLSEFELYQLRQQPMTIIVSENLVEFCNFTGYVQKL